MRETRVHPQEIDEAAGEQRGAPWLLEVGLVSSGRREYPLRALAASAAFYPFDMTLSGTDVSGNPRLEICRPGLDEDVVMLSTFRRTD